MRTVFCAVVVTLLVQLHGHAGSSSPFSIPPYLVNVTDSSAAVCWNLKKEKAGLLVYGASAAYTDTIPCAAASRTTAAIKGLKPNTRYYYNISLDDTLVFKERQEYFFTTFADDIRESCTFALLGDTRTGEESFGSDHAAVIESIRQYSHPSFLIHLGDLVDITEKGCWENYFSIESPLLRQCGLFPLRGNSDGTQEDFLSRFPRNGSSPWFSFSSGPVHCIMLDIQSRKPHSYYTGHIGPQSAQYSWLTNDLSSESRKKSAFTIVCFFTPLFLDDDEETEYCEKLLCPLFEQYNVDLVVNGSRHYFSRIMHSGISYMVSGGGGAVLELPKKEGREKAGFSHAAFHHLRVSMHYPVMTVDGIDNSGTVFFSQAFTANAEKIFPAGASSDAGFSPSLALFGSPGCDECRRVKEEIFPGLKQKYHGLSLRLDFYDVDKEANFSAYGDLESRLGNTKHQFPVLKIGNRLLSGTSLTFEAIDALIREQSAGNGKNAPKPHNGSPMVLFAAVFIALSAILLIVLLSQRRKMG